MTFYEHDQDDLLLRALRLAAINRHPQVFDLEVEKTIKNPRTRNSFFREC